MTFDELLSNYSEPVQAIARQARQTILSLLDDDAIERVMENNKNVVYSYTGEYMETAVYIAPFKAHANLGFFKGVDLPDPEGLLEGTGKNLRHVKLRAPDDVNKPAVQALIRAASEVADRPG